MPPDRRLERFAWTVLAYNLLVILWGALVRATGSGAGCGSHWPLCDGQIVPDALDGARAIEYAHRATSGLALLAVAALAVVAFRVTGPGHPARRSAVAATLFVLLEAALGAGLVLFELVGVDDSLARALVMPLHLVNTLLLVGALALVARAATGRPAPAWRASFPDRALSGAVLAALILAGASGAVAALGDTLFPARSLADGLAQDLSGTAHFLVRLRLAHPLLAAAAATLVLALAWRRGFATERPERWARRAGVLALAQVAIGIWNLGLLAPVALQLLHLLAADLLWIATLLAVAEAATPAAAGD